MKYLILTLKGIAYGVTNLVPGIGGGLILILMGIYEQFVDSVGNLLIERHKWREHLAFLVPIGIGMVIGMVAFAKLISLLMERYPVPMMFFFMGLLLGTLPHVLKMHTDMRLTVGRAASLLLGVALVALTRVLQPTDAAVRTIASLSTPAGILYNTFVSFLGGGASVTPGLDGSYALLLGGTYGPILEALSALTHLTIHWAILVPLGVAAVAGILIVSKLIDIAIKNIPSLSYYFIMGLILGSVYGLWPSQGLGGTPILVIVLAIVVGGALARIFGSSETPQSAPSKAS